MISEDEEHARFASAQLTKGCDAMVHLLNGLLDSKGKISEEVHAIRKLGKTLRGGFCLFGLGKTSAKEIQAIGRLLSGPRDAVSRLNTWNKLEWNADPSAAAAIHGLLEQHTHSAARKPPVETIAWCVERVAAAQSHLAELSEDQLAEKSTRGVRKLHKQVRKRFKKLERGGEEDFHDARKALKAYLGAIGFLPDGLVPPSPELNEIADLLGDENDIATLSLWLDGHGFSAKLIPSLGESVTTARRKLRKSALRDTRRWLTPEKK